MKCILCGLRKGKRSCPAKGGLICAQCCGEKRILEIDCPEDCEFLKIGRSHEIEEYKRFLRGIDPGRREVHQRTLQENGEVVAELEYKLAQERLSTRDLTDIEVAGALDLLLQTYRTEDKGILYEHTSADVQVEALRRTLRGVIESHRNPGQGSGEGVVGVQEKRLLLDSAIKCLEFIRDLVASHLSDRGSPTSYVDLLARIIPRGRPEDATRGAIIIP